jgi:hypothetical protein
MFALIRSVSGDVLADEDSLPSRSVRNAFSPSGSVFLAEFLKLLLSTALFFREWLWRRDDSNYWAVGDEVDGGDPSRMARRRAAKKSWWEFPRAFMSEPRQGSVLGFVQLAMLYAVINNDVCCLRSNSLGWIALLTWVWGMGIGVYVVSSRRSGNGSAAQFWNCARRRDCHGHSTGNAVWGIAMDSYRDPGTSIYISTSHVSDGARLTTPTALRSRS